LRAAAIENAKEITTRQMSESVERGQKGKKKKKSKSGPALSVTDTPDLSELGETVSAYHPENINISFTRPAVSTQDQRIADIIRYKMACEQELKMLEGMEGVLEQMRKTKSEWFVANNLLKDLLNQRSGFLGHSAASSLSSTVPESSQRPRKRRREEATSSSTSTGDREDIHRDGEYCLPLEEINQLHSDIVEALRKAEEDDDYDYT
jgi:hypothetical protein